VAALAEVVDVSVNDHGPTDDAAVAVQADVSVADVQLGHTVIAGDDVAQVTGVPLALRVVGCAVGAAVGVEVRSGAGAAVGVVTKLVNMESVLPRSQSTDLSGNLDSVPILDEVNDSVDLLGLEDTHGLACHLDLEVVEGGAEGVFRVPTQLRRLEMEFSRKSSQ